MPDWFYRTAVQRALFALPDEKARAIALGIIGTLGRSSPGRALIELLGHMGANTRLAVRIGGTEFASPIGLGWRVDPEQRASLGLECFGVGCIEVLADEQRDVVRTEGAQLHDQARCQNAISEHGKGRRPRLRRKIFPDGNETLLLPSGETLPVFAWDEEPANLKACASGVVLQVGTRDGAGGWNVPVVMPAGLAARVRVWRTLLQNNATVVVAGGVADPGDAVVLVDAGASLILVDAGLVFCGPGLVKRCNEALLRGLNPRNVETFDEPPARRAWFWACALGLALAGGGALTLGLALTRVLLPYDEHYIGLTAETLRRNSPRLFAFMAHDRATLAGTMLGLGWLYLSLGWHGIRRDVHGAKAAVVASALTGFASFFAFFGFGYFDALHAFVAAVLFQITVQILVGRTGGKPTQVGPVDNEDGIWRHAQWSQLLWIIHAFGLLIAGGVILGIGMTSVFVREDLDFLCLTGSQALELGDRMIGVVAHDRATLGGMLLASGTAMLLPLLWCYRRSAYWLWWAMAGLGIPAYAAALGVHLWVGYTDWRHMVPALLGAGLWLGGLLLGRSYLLAETRTKS
jgi:hypothetical protein